MQSKENLHWEFHQNNESIVLQLSGELSRNTLLPLWHDYFSFLSSSKFDKQYLSLVLSDLTHIDSAGFAFLCELIEEVKDRVSLLKIVSYPNQLIILANLFGLSNWIKPFLQSSGNIHGNTRN